MAKRKHIEPVVTDVEQETVTITRTEQEPESTPSPVLNRGPQGWIKVRARVHLAEADRTGNMVHRSPGEVFEVTEARAKAIAGIATEAD
jgi:hypothetical protein